MLVYVFNFREEARALCKRGANGRETRPKGEDDDLRLRPDLVDAVDEFDVGLLEFRSRDVVDGVVVIGTDVDDCYVRRRVSREIPYRRIVTVNV